MQYAIVICGGKQYKVSVGQEILVDKLNQEVGKPYAFDRVLLVRNGEDVLLGNPYVTQVQVLGKVVGEAKGDKITISKFKAKVHYRKKIGFRPLYSKILIESISVNGKSSAPAPAKKRKSSGPKAKTAVNRENKS